MNNIELKQEYFNLRDKIIEKFYDNLNHEQREAVLSDSKANLVAACPGSGKTVVIINRTDYLTRFGPIYKSDSFPEDLSEEHIIKMKSILSQSREAINLPAFLTCYAINTDNIVVITFTKAAANNMKERYLTKFNKSKSPYFGTMHSLFYKILITHLGKINIIESWSSFRVVKEVLMSYIDNVTDEKIKEVLNDISLFKTRQSMGETLQDFEPRIDKPIFQNCIETYENFKNTNDLLDFDDLQIRCRQLFNNNTNILQRYRSLFKHILVDEFQDCDFLQMELLKLLTKDGSIFAVGDEDQSIYGFRGSSPDCMVNFNSYFNNGSRLCLTTNYRSCPEIVVLAKNLIKNNKGRFDKEMIPHKKEQGAVNYSMAISEKEQSERIAEEIQQLIKIEKSNLREIAVLYRTNVESRGIIDSLMKNKIEFKLLDKEYDFFNHFICKDIIAYFKLALDNSDHVSFQRIINKPFRYISKVNIEKVVKNISKKNCFQLLKEIEDVPIYQLKSIDKLETQIKKLNKKSLHEAVEFILHEFDYLGYLKSYSDRIKIDIQELLDVVEEFKEATCEYNAIIPFLVHVEETEKAIKDKKPKENAVTLSTIHGVKGMEFENVFIINCNEDNIPHVKSSSSVEEERRLFYVAVTRSIKKLWLSHTKMIKGKFNEPSRFLNECNLKKEKLTLPYEMGEQVFHKSFGQGRIIKINQDKIDIEFINGDKRSFDLHSIVKNRLLNKVI